MMTDDAAPPLSSQNPVATVFDVLWRIMQPVMFCLIGADLEFGPDDKNRLLLGSVVLLFAWLVSGVASPDPE